MNMRFCDDCGTYLRKTKDRLWCPKCRKLIKTKRVLGIRRIEKRHSAAIHVIDKSQVDHVKLSRTYARCGNGEAYDWFSNISGEHAGIRRERTVEHFRCSECSYSWSECS